MLILCIETLTENLFSNHKNHDYLNLVFTETDIVYFINSLFDLIKQHVVERNLDFLFKYQHR